MHLSLIFGVHLLNNKMEFKMMAIVGPCEHTPCPIHSKCIALSSGQATCIFYECPEYQTSLNAYVTSGVSNAVGSVRQYACPSDMTWIGGDITCGSTGTWQSQYPAEGCLALASGTCLDDSACSSILNSICRTGKCVCPVGFAYISETSICAKDCKSLYLAGNTSNGIYEIIPDGSNAVNTYCDMVGGGWTVFERRSVGDLDFSSKNWEDYRFSFGSPDGDFWLGLEYLHDLTVADSDVYFDYTIKTGDAPFFAQYHNFSVADNSNKFKMTVSSFFEMTAAYTSIRYGGFYDHNNMMFSTQDSDNDISSTDCASNRGAWWWKNCYTFGMFLYYFHDMRMFMGGNDYVYFKDTVMKVRRTK